VGEGVREVVYWLVESTKFETKEFQIGREVVYWSSEFLTNGQLDERGRKVRKRMGKGIAKLQVGERRGKVINRAIKISAKS
jgi:hypothetical protein